jgi:hypothetical protein
VTPLRLEEIALFCEDRAKGRSQQLLEIALQELRKDLPFASDVVPIGISSKDDVQVRAKFARQDRYRAVGLRDRDFLPRDIVDDYRRMAFHADAERIRPWPLQRYCIESYLLDIDVLGPAIPAADPAALQAVVEAAAAARRWLDVARGTFDDLAWRLRRAHRGAIKDRLEWPSDRESALGAVRDAVDLVRRDFTEAHADDHLVKKLDALDSDMESDGPLRHRVDGRQLVADVERALASGQGAIRPPGGLLSALDKRARAHPPVALLADLRILLENVPGTWRSTDG